MGRARWFLRRRVRALFVIASTLIRIAVSSYHRVVIVDIVCARARLFVLVARKNLNGAGMEVARGYRRRHLAARHCRRCRQVETTNCVRQRRWAPGFFFFIFRKVCGGYLDQVLEPLFWPRREDADIVGGDRRVQIARFPSSPSGERKQKQVENFEKFVSLHSLIGSVCQD